MDPYLSESKLIFFTLHQTQNQYFPSTGCDVTGTLCQQKRTQENMNIVQYVIPEVTDGSLFI